MKFYESKMVDFRLYSLKNRQGKYFTHKCWVFYNFLKLRERKFSEFRSMGQTLKNVVKNFSEIPNFSNFLRIKSKINPFELQIHLFSADNNGKNVFLIFLDFDRNNTVSEFATIRSWKNFWLLPRWTKEFMKIRKS